MSDTQRATEIVHAALQAMQDRGLELHAGHEALARLAETAGKSGAASRPDAAGTGARPAATATSATAAAPMVRERAQPPMDMRAALAAQLEASESKTPAASQNAAPAAASAAARPFNFVAVAGASQIAPATGSKAERLAAMRGPVLACTKCPHLVKSRTQVVFGVGSPDAELMFVGEAPGADEDLVGEPFVGRAGQLLTKIIETMGLRRADVYIANILKCRPNMPPGAPGNRKPEPDEMRTCKPYVLEQINIIQPRVIVALGGTAVEGLFDIAKAGITRMRGQWRDFEGIPVMPTFHPSFLLRPSSEQQANKRLVWEDMLTVLEKLGRPVTEKQRGFFLTRG
jgi:DNA polymerase